VSHARRCGARPGLNERGLGDRGTGDFRRAVGVLVRSLPAPVDPTRSDGDFGDFIYAVYAEYVARHGCTAEDLEFSLSALRKITTRFSAEFAIRPFLNLSLTRCCNLADLDRGRALPRTSAVQGGHATAAPMRSEPDAALRRRHPLLDRLSADPTRYVTWSVANDVTTSPRRTRTSRSTPSNGGEAQGTSGRARWLRTTIARGIVPRQGALCMAELFEQADAKNKPCWSCAPP
jgi:hypothetical protein